MTRGTARFHPYGVLIAAVVLVGWIWPATTSLWLDETGTWWIVKDGIRDVFERSYYWTNFSPYYVLAWLAAQVGGGHEFVLRLPSLLSALGAAWCIVRIGARLGDAELGWIAAVLFTVLHPIAFAATDARPYAFTLMVLTAHVLSVLWWLERPGARRGVVVALTAALTAYGHVLLAVSLAGPALYAWWRTRHRLHLVVIWVAAAILLIPLGIQLRDYMAMDVPHMFADRPTLPDYLSAIAPPQLFAALIIGLGLAHVWRPLQPSEWRPAPSMVLLLLGWLIVAPSLFFLLGRLTAVQVFLSRYLLSTAPALALIGACAIRSVQGQRNRLVVVGVMTGLSLTGWVFSSTFHHAEHWRSAIAEVRDLVREHPQPVVTASCFIEAQTPESLDDPRLAEVLFAPLVRYPVDAPLVRLPYAFDEAFTIAMVERHLRDVPRFLLLTCFEGPTTVWFEDEAGRWGFAQRSESYHRGVRVAQFSRQASCASEPGVR